MKNTYIDIAYVRNEISLSILLSALGHQPVKRSAGELFYHSMIRDGDSKPSFCVNDKQSLWFDHGLGIGGNIIDFAKQYWPDLTFNELLHKINGVVNSPFQFSRALGDFRVVEQNLDSQSSHYEIINIHPLGGSQRISAYLKQREVLGVAATYLKEVHYTILNESGDKRNYCAAGWANENGGWEVRNASFKGCLGKKGMSFLPGTNSKLAVFEGFLDFLSWKKDNPTDLGSILVMNSVAYLNAAIDRSRNYSAVEIFFDHDNAGLKATAAFLENIKHARNGAEIYMGFNDYNEMLMSRPSCEHKLSSGNYKRKY